ncbi:MAG TPA: hypothetical protein VFU23_09315 [Gemmatimonadales bacterium]|nr:hypothetical protein [Gemmatimonadales bacterium]
MRISWSLVPLLLALPLAAQQKIDRRIPVASDASIRITNMAGLTRVTGWDLDSIAVTGSVPAGANFYLAGRGQYAKMGVERRDETLAEPGSTLEVKVPRNARVWVKSGTANIEVTGLRGEVECVSVSGSIRVEGSLKLLIAESMEGNLNASGPMDVVRLKGGAGTITIRGPRGDISASTVGGAIVAMDGAVVRAHLETVSGTIAYDGSLDPRGTLESVTHSGDVTLRLPPEISAEFDLESFDGAMLVGIGGKGGKGEKSLKGKPLSFVTGAGGSHVVVRSFKGEIRILNR